MNAERPIKTWIEVNDATIAGDDPFAVIDPVWWTATFYFDLKAYEASLQRFSRPQRLIWAVLWYDAEVHNGGHDQFFDDSTGMVWPDALEGLEGIGRLDLASILSEAVRRFPTWPVRERDERQEQMSSAKVSFAGLDEEYWGISRAINLREALMAYIRQQPEAFYFSGTVRRSPPREAAL